MRIPIHLENHEYDIILEKNCLQNTAAEINLERKVLFVSDRGVPEKYVETAAQHCKAPLIAIVPEGEQSKSLEQYARLLSLLAQNNFTRSDAVIAVGGGVVGDLAGFVAASYMRGIDFYNIPTTLLAQLDSSIGGKTAINFAQIKNIVGAFYQPKKVLIDPLVLQTLPSRQLRSGLAEAIKMAAAFDQQLFSLIKNKDAFEEIETVIEQSLRIKAAVVEKDEKEQNLRKVLNFGHTIGHAIEVNSDLHHGECVAIGMLYFCSDAVRGELQSILQKYSFPTKTDLPAERLYQAVLHDKKAAGNQISIVRVEKIGSYELRNMTFDQFRDFLTCQHALVNGGSAI